MVIIATLSRYADGAWGQPDIFRSRWSGRSSSGPLPCWAPASLSSAVKPASSSSSIGEDADDRIAQRCAAEYPRANNPTPMTVDALRRLVPSMRTGDLGAAFAAALTGPATVGARMKLD
ncbi:hypothetical protein [Plantactinospora sp. DSM 117369]